VKWMNYWRDSEMASPVFNDLVGSLSRFVRLPAAISSRASATSMKSRTVVCSTRSLMKPFGVFSMVT
jgi:hypothetical protein